MGYFADGPGTSASAGQNYGFSMAAEQRPQTGQTVSDAFGPVNSFDPTADRLSLGSRPNTGDAMRVFVKPDGTRVMMIGDGSTPGAGVGGSGGVGGRGELSSSAMYAAGYGDIRETVTSIAGNGGGNGGDYSYIDGNGGDYSYIDGNGVINVVGQRMTAAEAAAFDARLRRPREAGDK